MKSALSSDPRPSVSIMLVQLVWLVLVSVAVGKFLVSEIVYLRGIQEICTAPVLVCHDRQEITPQDAASLQADGISPSQWALYNAAFRTVIALVYTAVGAILFARKRNEGAALFTSLFLILFGTIGGFGGFLSAKYPGFNLLFSLIEYPAYVCIPLFFFSFPNGRVVPRAMWLIVLIWSLFFLVDSVVPGIDKSSGWYNLLAGVAWMSMFGGGAASQLYRYVRVSNAEERRQIKWVVFAVVILFAVVIVAFLLPPFSEWLDNAAPHSARQLLVLVPLNLTTTLIPIAIGIAIFKYRLYEIDIIIRRTLIYTTLTAMLLLFYLGSVVVLQQLLRGLSGQGSDLAIILSTLGIAALFNPLRERVQRVIDRRFYRHTYDAQKILAQFGARVRDEVELNRLTDDLLSTVDETMRPASVSLWLRRPEDQSR